MVDKQYFTNLSEFLLNRITDNEFLSLNLSSEKSRFCRFNEGKVRQDGTVNDAVLHATLTTLSKNAPKHLSMSVSLSQNFDQDCQKTATLLASLRNDLAQIPCDPYARVPCFDHKSNDQGAGTLIPQEDVVQNILPTLGSFLPTGIYSGGHILRGQTSSAGSSHWFSTPSWVLDYSLYGTGERAWKGFLGGTSWNQQNWFDKIEQARVQLDVLERPWHSVQPGKYRVYLAPDAVADLLWFLGSIFSEASLRRKSSPLCLVKSGSVSFSPHLNFAEDFGLGDTPGFTSEGELIPKYTPLVTNGELQNTLVGSRSAKEYNIPSNGASNSEMVRAAHLNISNQNEGTFSEKDALRRLDTGLYISNLHYLNWSDRPKGRITGMTRYACFWVKNGQLEFPIENLRWDDTLFNLFGGQMEATTATVSTFPFSGSYGMRSIGSHRCPGVLLKSMNFTL